jgi:hypothetical protein
MIDTQLTPLSALHQFGPASFPAASMRILVVGSFDCGVPLSVEFQLLNLPCHLPPLQRNRNKRSFYVRILCLRSQTLTFFRLIKVSPDPRIQTAAIWFSKASKYLPPSR